MLEILALQKIGASEKLILLFVFFNGPGVYTYQDFMTATNLSRPTVGRCLQNLIKEGYLLKSTEVSATGYSIISYEFCDSPMTSPSATSKPCYVYVQRLHGVGLTIGKVGIAFNVVERIKDQSKKSLFRHELLYSRLFSCYAAASSVERHVLKSLPRFNCNKDWLPDGYTETIDERDIESAIKLIGETK